MPVGAKIIGAGVPVIQHAERLVYTGSGCITEISCAKILVIAVFHYVDALPVHTVIICAGVAVIKYAGGIENTIACNASIICAGVVIITYFRRMQALPVYTNVLCAGIRICTVSRLENAYSIHTAVNRANVVIITNDGRESAYST